MECAVFELILKVCTPFSLPSIVHELCMYKVPHQAIMVLASDWRIWCKEGWSSSTHSDEELKFSYKKLHLDFLVSHVWYEKDLEESCFQDLLSKLLSKNLEHANITLNKILYHLKGESAGVDWWSCYHRLSFSFASCWPHCLSQKLLEAHIVLLSCLDKVQTRV